MPALQYKVKLMGCKPFLCIKWTNSIVECVSSQFASILYIGSCAVGERGITYFQDFSYPLTLPFACKVVQYPAVIDFIKLMGVSANW